MIINVDEVFPDSLDGPRYERHIGQIGPTPSESETTQNDSEGGASVVIDGLSNPSSSPKLTPSPGKEYSLLRFMIIS